MRRNIKNIQFVFFGTILILSMLSCTDKKWDIYDEKPSFLNEGSLFNLLSNKPEFSEFMGLIRKTGYDSVLKRTDLFTVLAVKNGSFSAIDTGVNSPELKRLIGMHIIPSAIYQEQMKDNRYQTVSGKYVSFFKPGANVTVNNIPVSTEAFKALNGLAYGIDHVINPLNNLREIISSNPDFSLFAEYITLSYSTAIDIPKNVVIGYDAMDRPIYQQPIIYRRGSTYMDTVKLDDEKTISTLFIPTNQAVNNALANLLTARANQNSLIVPKVGPVHRDTTIGYFFIPRNVPYAGDSAILKNYLFKNIITRAKVATLANGNNTFSNVTGGQFSINSSNTQLSGATASNGNFYVLNEVNLPEVVYRRTFVFDPSLQHPTDPNQIVVNPNMVFSGGASATTTVVNPGNNAPINPFPIHSRARQFNFANVGGRIDFTLPFITRGNYKVILVEVPILTGTILNASFGNVQLKQGINGSIQYTLPAGPEAQPGLNVDLGNIYQAADGAATITLKCASIGPLSSSSYAFVMCNIRFVPI